MVSVFVVADNSLATLPLALIIISGINAWHCNYRDIEPDLNIVELC